MPVKKLLFNNRFLKPLIAVNVLGIVPVREFLSMYNASNLVSVDRLEGMVPTRLLLCSVSKVKDVISCIVEGMPPDKELSSNASTCSDLSPPKDVGIMPVSLF